MPEPASATDAHPLAELAGNLPAVLFVLDHAGRPVHLEGACTELLGAPADRYLTDRWAFERDAAPLHATTTTALHPETGARRTYGVLVSAAPGRDPVTNLPGRALLLEHLKLATARARSGDGRVVVLHIALDGLDLVGAGLGRAAHEQVVREVAARVRNAAADTALVASVGDGELVVMLADLEADAAHRAEAAAGQAIVAAGRPLEVDGERFELTPRVGASMLPGDAADAEALLRHAEGAMREARREGSGRVLFYDGGTSEALERLLVTSRLRRALDRDELVLHFQPMFRLAGTGIAAVEALLRWEDPERGLVPPLDFVPVAEHTGLIEPIGRWVIEECCRQAATWRDQGLTVAISFNVSPRQFRDPTLLDHLADRIAEHALDPSLLMVEVTESVAMREPSCVEPVLHGLRELGVRLAIDDFGAGHSSLARLRDMQVDVLKIDRGFLVGAPGDRRATKLLQATLDLVDALDMTPVAEGVETEQQRSYLAGRGCTLAQGYHLGRPLPADAVTPLLRAHPAAA